MKKIITLSILLSAISSYSQVWYWGATSTGTGITIGSAISRAPNGNVNVAAHYRNDDAVVGNHTLALSGQTDIMLIQYSSSGSVLWAKKAGGTGDDFVLDAITDKQGNIYIAGRFDSQNFVIGTQTLSCAGTEDGYVAKFNSSGTFQWVKHYTGPGFESVAGVAVDSSGNVFITGEYTSNPFVAGGHTLTPLGAGDMFNARLDASGNIVWIEKVIGIYQDEPLSIAADKAGNIFITGRSISPSFTAGTISQTFSPTGYQSSYFLLKYNSSGVPQWIRASSNGAKSNGYNVAVDDVGGVYVTGDYSNGPLALGTQTLSIVGSMSWCAYIAKYDLSGNLQWAKRPVTDYAFGYGLAANSSGVYLSGPAQFPIVWGTYTLNPPANNYLPFWLVKFDVAGNELCATVPNTGTGDGTDIFTDVSDEVFITGMFVHDSMALGNTTLTPGQANTMFVAKYSCDCRLPLLTASTSSAIVCTGQSVMLTATGASSYSWSTGHTTNSISVTPTINSVYTVSTTIAGVCTATAAVSQSVVVCTGLFARNAEGLKMFPNPASSHLMVTGEVPEGSTLVLFDTQGRCVSRTAVKNSSLVDLRNVSNGLYYYEIRTNDAAVTAGKLVIQH